MSRQRTLVAVLLAVLVLVAGCSGGGDSAQLARSGGDGGVDAGAEATPAAEEAATEKADAGDAATATTRYRIQRGSVTLEVDSYASARENLTALVEERGGYLSDATQQAHQTGNETWTTGRLILRVPAEQFDATFEAIKAEGETREASISTEDVTGRVVDLEARLENLRAERDQLRSLYRRANDTEDVLQVQRRLADVQSEIERTEAQLTHLKEQVNYATVTVELREPRPDPEPTPVSHWYDTGVVAAFLESVHGVVVVARALVVGTAYVAPYVLAFGVPVALLATAVRRWRGGVLPIRSD
jgi:hypothetical protein